MTTKSLFPLLDFFFVRIGSIVGDTLIGIAGSGSGVATSSGSTSITSSTGCIVSKSSKPGASGIGPRTRSQIDSIALAVIGFSTQPIAPAE
jgi:hypothetical protein